MGQFTDKIAVVTGASRGLGKAIALELASEGATVACLATRAENAAAVIAEIIAAGGRAHGFGCHVERSAEVAATFSTIEEELGAIDILVNNAGIADPQPTLDMSEASWDQHMDINAKSVFLCSQAAARQMKGRGGVIINIGSIVGQNAFPATLGYCTSKAAVDHMTRVMAIEWARIGIRVNCIAPGYVQTDLIDELAAQGKLTVQDLERRTPQRRLGTGREIARAVVYVASDDAAFMTGEVMVIDGGWNAFGYYQARKGTSE
jgi:NAD(P)-dependent dehydrogenase (short-subunit alcohol dehydrogenase family)